MTTSDDLAERIRRSVQGFEQIAAAAAQAIRQSEQSGGSGAGSTAETSEPMPRGVIHDPGCCCWPHIEASAVTQLRADLEAAQSELEAARNTHLQTLMERDYYAQQMAQARARIETAVAYQRAVKTLEAHEETCRDGPCDLCELYGGGVMEAEAALFQALDAAQAAGTTETGS